jgi:hypothetical protein
LLVIVIKSPHSVRAGSVAGQAGCGVFFSGFLNHSTTEETDRLALRRQAEGRSYKCELDWIMLNMARHDFAEFALSVRM